MQIDDCFQRLKANTTGIIALLPDESFLEARSLNWETIGERALAKYQDEVSAWVTEEKCSLVADVFLLMNTRGEEFITSVFIDRFLDSLAQEIDENDSEFFDLVSIDDFTECVEALATRAVYLSEERKRHRDTYFHSELQSILDSLRQVGG